MNSPNHSWRFFRAGDFSQVALQSGADLAHLDQLDQKLWVALACPTTGLEFDPATLALIDTDRDGRIRAPELIAAAKWLMGLLKDPDSVLKRSPSLPLSLINDATPEGQQILASAKQILINLGRGDSEAISLDDVTDTSRIFAQTAFNGDGIIPADAASDDATRQVIQDIIGSLGSEMDRSGKPGIGEAKIDEFFATAQAYVNWANAGDASVLPLGNNTAAAAAAVRAVKAKVDDYFTRCRLASFDADAIPALNPERSDYLEIGANDLTESSAAIADLPLARIAGGRPLPLSGTVNPAWTGSIAALRETAVAPLLGQRSELTESDWTALVAKLAPYEAWMGGKAGAMVESLGLERLQSILKSNAAIELKRLLHEDRALEPQANAIASVERLVRYHRDLFQLCTNFVNFRDFYSRTEPAIFQAGTLFMDQRSCDFTLPVEDPAKHALMAGLAGTYLAYCDCVRKGTGEKRQIVAAFTNGDSENLMVGRNGIFYDRKGRDWDATIVRIVDNPISLRQAFWSPYKKFVRLIEEQVAKRAATADTASQAKLETAATSVAEADKLKMPPTKKVDVGTVAAIGVAAGSLGTALGFFLKTMTEVKIWQIALILLGIVLIISMPAVVIAWLKLRKRNLGPILDANGWAVNARARINVPFGKSLTQIPFIPPGAMQHRLDPFADKKRVWPYYVALALIVIGIGCAWYHGYLDRYLPERVTSTRVLGTGAPAYPSVEEPALPTIPAAEEQPVDGSAP